MTTQKAAFNAAVDDTLGACLNVSNQRGGEYQDTWALENMVTTFLDATLRDLHIVNLTAEEKRLLIVAALVDVKDSRMLGPWKEDTVDDGINYRAAYRAWRSAYTPAVIDFPIESVNWDAVEPWLAPYRRTTELDNIKVSEPCSCGLGDDGCDTYCGLNNGETCGCPRAVGKVDTVGSVLGYAPF